MCDKQYRFRPGSLNYYNLGLYHVVNDNTGRKHKESEKLIARSSRRAKNIKLPYSVPANSIARFFVRFLGGGHLRGEFAGVVICIARV